MRASALLCVRGLFLRLVCWFGTWAGWNMTGLESDSGVLVCPPRNAGPAGKRHPRFFFSLVHVLSFASSSRVISVQ